MLKSTGFLLMAALVTSGCSTVGVTRLSPSTPKASTCELDVYVAEDEIKRTYENACLIDSRTGSTAFHTKNAAAAIENARPKACECGADALVIMNTDTQGPTYASWGQGMAILKAIRYTD